MNKFSSKVSWIIITFFIGAIIISFTLTGFQGLTSASNSVATVDGTSIGVEEYRRILDMKVARYSQMFGGKSLTSQQIKQFGIREQALRELVTQKLVMNFAVDMGLDVGQKEVKEVIKNLPYFKTGDKFDVNKYKQLLAANRMSPSKFEQSTEEELLLGRVQSLLGSLEVSKEYVKDLQRFKANTVVVNEVQFDKESLTQYLTIPDSEIKAFANDEKNENTLKSLYASLEDMYKQEEQVKARHILFKIADPTKEKDALKKANDLRSKLTTDNFADMAKKHTDEAPGKKSGGDLGWFGKGRMVKEFEDTAFKLRPGQISGPIKSQFGYHIIYVEDRKAAKETPFEKAKTELAKIHLQKNARKELHELVEKVTAQFETALKAKDTKKLKSLSEKYGATFEASQSLNMLEPKTGSIQFSEENLKSLFKNRDPNGFIKENEGEFVKMLAVVEYKTDSEQMSDSSFDALLKEQERELSVRFNQSVVSELEKKAKIIEYPAYL